MSENIKNTIKELKDLVRESSNKRIEFFNSLSLDKLNSLNSDEIVRQAD